ncbi:MAG: phospho-sugar mutase [Candidatus Tectomicrobia bacterium]|nr:phospho-sugar mutase [Candidatus Tectomicrobia bacterium]
MVEITARIPAAAIEAGSLEALRRWLRRPSPAAEREQIEQLIAAQDWQELNDSFYTIIPFGTGGRRGKMGVGPNRMNLRTIGESAQGLARYLLKQGRESGGHAESGASLSHRIVIGHDTRHQARRFAEECACIVAAHGFMAYLFDGCRSTPEVSFAVRHLGADAGIVISASHNPPTDNGFKVYWRDGGQVLPPHDTGIIDEVQRVDDIQRLPYQAACERGLIVLLGAEEAAASAPVGSPGFAERAAREVDRAYVDAVAATALGASRRLRLVYTPLHGAGVTNVVPVLRRAGFTDLHLVAAQSTPDGDFPNVAGHIPNPESPAALTEAIALAREIDADLAMASDPDADRLGVAVPLRDGSWRHLSGNQLGALLSHYVLRTLRDVGRLPKDGLLVKTMVSTDLVTRIAADFQVRLVGDLLVGFKYIAELIGKLDDPERFIFGFEESFGYLRGAAVRDKDAASAALLTAELAAELKAEGATLDDYLHKLYRRYGYFFEETRNFFMTGSAGERTMVRVMERLRREPPQRLGGLPLRAVIDRQTGAISDPRDGAQRGVVVGARGNVLVYQLSEDGFTKIVIRPSGTEPKLKIYGFGNADVPATADDATLAGVQRQVQERTRALLDEFERLTLRYQEDAA